MARGSSVLSTSNAFGELAAASGTAAAAAAGAKKVGYNVLSTVSAIAARFERAITIILTALGLKLVMGDSFDWAVILMTIAAVLLTVWYVWKTFK